MVNKKKNIIDNNNIKISAVNLLLNVIIFILAVVVVYLLYSLILKSAGGIDSPQNIEPAGTPSEVIQVEVLNGCGVSGIADRFTDFLRSKKADVVRVDNYITFDVENTMVLDRTGNRANAEEIARALGVKNKFVIEQINRDYFLDVSVIIGKDYYKLNPLKTGE